MIAGNVIDIWAAWMWACTWQVLLLIAIVAIVDRLLRHRLWPQFFMCLWAVVLLKLILPPQLGSPWSVTQPLFGDTGAPGFLEPLLAGTLADDSASTLEWIKALLFVVWLAGVAGLTVIYLRRYFRTTAAMKRCRPAPSEIATLADAIAGEMGIRSRCEIRVCPLIRMPGMFGVLKPVIVLPQDVVVQASPAEIRSILVHELAHVRRGDAAFRMLTHAVLIWYWFNPALILLRRRLAELQEICCDATAMSHMHARRDDYVTTLLNMGRRILENDAQAEPGALLSIFGSPSGLNERIQKLKNEPRRLSSRQRKIIGFVVLNAFKITVFPMGNPDAVMDSWYALTR